RTTDLGNSWEDISGFGTNSISDNGFPDVAVYSLLVRPDNPTMIWAGTEIGIFESTDNGVSWSFLEGGLGAAAVWEMNVTDDQVVIATHGRGIFTATLPEVQEVVIVPEILGAGTTAKGDFNIEVDFKSAYDSSFISLNGNTELLFNATEKDIYTILFTSFPPNDSINIELVCYQNEKKYKANSFLTSHYQINEPVETYIQDFNSGTNDFTGRGFEIMAYDGFDDFAIHSKHPYEEGTEFIEGQINYLFNLKTPIIVSGRNSEIEYDNIAIVEPGEFGSRYPQEDFYDYVVLEGSKDGLNWKPIRDPYVARKDTKWLNAYNSKLDGDKSMFAKHQAKLRNYFAFEDTVLLRFRMFSDPLTVGWGWAIDNLSIQPPITAINQEIELKQNVINLYPNPASNVATLDYVLHKESKVQLF
ncbi:MAG: hypothetical protein KAI29_03500, partial [Cyclobacteriaceae bacterium]|nr:hypothetical protein [Cyclobacteriaceae bacterium]